MVAVLLVDVGLAIYILPKDPAMDLFIYSDGVQVDFTIGVNNKMTLTGNFYVCCLKFYS